MARLELDNVSLTFQVRQQGRITLKEFLVGGKFREEARASVEVEALRSLNLRLADGDRVGVIGHNGAGKSTLLKLLAGVYPPTAGNLVVEGQISSLFDIALGFEPEATGWDNIRYRSYLQGETPQTIEPKIRPIAEFSELGRFLDMPVRFYSAGMLVRLAFAIATAIDPEILLVDEVLSAGDLAFQAKARERMREMIARARLLVMVSHDLDSLSRLCARGLWLDHGCIVRDGPMDEVIAAYQEAVGGTPKTEVIEPRHSIVAAPSDLRHHERRVYSQNGEDGILEEIFRRIGTENRFFVEVGIGISNQCNAARLSVEEGWSGLFIEAEAEHLDYLLEHYADPPRVRCLHLEASSDTIEAIMQEEDVPYALDLLSIDLDGNDYWVWQAIRRWRPRVVVIEFNAAYPPPRRWVMKETPHYRWNGTTYYGASLASLEALARRKGYTLVGTNSNGVNAFFVRDDLVTAERFLDPVLAYHYSPPTYGAFAGSHPPAEGPCVEI